MSGSLLQPALLAGLVIGVLSALPVVSAGNCCCCMWVVGGGALGAWLLQQNTPRAITMTDGLLVGVLAGVIGTVVSVPVSLLAQAVIPGYGDPSAIIERMLERAGSMPPEFRDALERVSESSRSAGGVLTVLVMFVLSLVINLVFATLGGLLGAVFFRKGPETADWAPPAGGPPPPPPIPPPAI